MRDAAGTDTNEECTSIRTFRLTGLQAGFSFINPAPYSNCMVSILGGAARARLAPHAECVAQHGDMIREEAGLAFGNGDREEVGTTKWGSHWSALFLLVIQRIP